jgi:hypothetical protein
MTGIVSSGRRGHTVVPNWRWEDPALDTYDLRIAGWIASHADAYRDDHVTRNEISRKTAISRARVSTSLERLQTLRIITVAWVESDRSGTRFMITFDFDLWVGVDATRPGGGRHTSTPPDATRPPSSIGEQVEEQHGEPRDTDFEAFWSIYRHKVAKPRARKAWKAAVKKALADEILTGALAWGHYWDRAHTEERFIPHPTTWLNGEQWNDAPPTLKRTSKAMNTLDRMARGELG